MDTRQLLLELETSFETYAGVAPVRDVVLAGLRYPSSDYWAALGLTWVEQGAALDSEIVERLSEIASSSRHYEQRTRHRASRLANLVIDSTKQVRPEWVETSPTASTGFGQKLS